MGSTALATQTGVRAFCTFRAGDRLYGIDVESLREISTNVSITPVPQAPPAVRGLANLRSRILLVLDLRPLLGLPPIECTQDSRLIILKPVVAEDVGILVDRGGEIVRVPQDRIDDLASHSKLLAGTSGSDARQLVVAVCKLEEELLMIIDATRFSDTVANRMR